MDYFGGRIRSIVKSSSDNQLFACEICNKIFFQTSRFLSYLIFYNIYQSKKKRERGCRMWSLLRAEKF